MNNCYNSRYRDRTICTANYAGQNYTKKFLEVQIKDDAAQAKDLKCQYRYLKNPEHTRIYEMSAITRKILIPGAVPIVHS